MNTAISRQLHRLAEKVVVLEDRVNRYGKALAETRGDSLDRAYKEGEFDGVCWVLGMVDMDMPWKEVVKEMEAFCKTHRGVPSLPLGGDDAEKTDEDEEEEDDD